MNNTIKKALVMSLSDINTEGGYKEKLKGQCNFFASNGYKVLLVSLKGLKVFSGEFFLDNNSFQEKKSSSNHNSKILKRLSFLIYSYLVLKTQKHIKILYIRYPRTDLFFLLFLFLTKLSCRRLKIVFEVPTYPFNLERPKTRTAISIIEDINSLLFNWITFRLPSVIAVVGFDGKIFGRHVVRIENGVNVDSFPTPLEKPKHREKLNLVMTSHFNDTNLRHGLDRFLEGLILYFSNSHSNTDIQLYVIGDLTKKNAPQLFNLINTSKINERVHLLGEMYGNDLKDFYQKMHVGIGCLAFHRVGVKYSSSLKEHEYLASGLPIISGSPDRSIPKKTLLRLELPADDSPVDIDSLIQFCDKIYSGSGANRQIQLMAKKFLSWNICLKPLLDYIEPSNLDEAN